MKTLSLLLTLFSCGALLRSPCLAAPSIRTSDKALRPGARNERTTPRVGPERAKPGATLPLPAPVKRSDLHSASAATAGGLHGLSATQPGLGKERMAPKPTATRENHPALLPHSSAQMTALEVNPVHKHGPAPAALGGLTVASAARSTAAINGTGFKHKP